MKAIPTGFCEAADRAAIPGRPWWRSINGGFTRNVGGFNVWPGVPIWMGANAEAEHRANPRNVFVAPLEWLPGNPRADLSDVTAAVERIDAEHPIPHPGYRAGQVWLIPWWASWDTVVLMHARDNGVTSTSLFNLGSFIAGSPHYLLYDPIMPSKAPWSSV